MFGIRNIPSANAELRKIEAYDGAVRGELEHAMSASSSPPLSSHRIAIVMSPVGRFLECRDCQLSFDFPAGALHDVIVKQFGSHLCGLPIHVPGWRLKTS
jgi:hypothetical protein